MSYQEIKEKAIALSLKERAALAHELLQTLEERSKEEITRLWLEEIWHRQVIEKRRGEETISFDEMKEKLLKQPQRG